MSSQFLFYAYTKCSAFMSTPMLRVTLSQLVSVYPVGYKYNRSFTLKETRVKKQIVAVDNFILF